MKIMLATGPHGLAADFLFRYICVGGRFVLPFFVSGTIPGDSENHFGRAEAAARRRRNPSR
ncbi:hypothetical protein NITHO_3430018 [Nitrolancea hollandica Lb]|uniref:Uncharacterized protein n=1 Tax=Nitrolancea hollandica Lb TaxID=1129897 RepID=I4EIG1_9BACT|nr:hypothetical protein NITHO_3430018 [Nitrolancea hollandica Lb]